VGQLLKQSRDEGLEADEAEKEKRGKGGGSAAFGLHQEFRVHSKQGMIKAARDNEGVSRKRKGDE